MCPLAYPINIRNEVQQCVDVRFGKLSLVLNFMRSIHLPAVCLESFRFASTARLVSQVFGFASWY